MTPLEYLLWRFYRWRETRPCRRGEHIPDGPSLCADGVWRYSCARGCGWRIHGFLIGAQI
jgi:hypothetical protein